MDYWHLTPSVRHLPEPFLHLIGGMNYSVSRQSSLPQIFSDYEWFGLKSTKSVAHSYGSHSMLNIRFILVVWVSSRKCLHALMFMEHIIFHMLSLAAAPIFTLRLNMSFKPPTIENPSLSRLRPSCLQSALPLFFKKHSHSVAVVWWLYRCDVTTLQKSSFKGTVSVHGLCAGLCGLSFSILYCRRIYLCRGKTNLYSKR